MALCPALRSLCPSGKKEPKSFDKIMAAGYRQALPDKSIYPVSIPVILSKKVFFSA
jgi:hypothetical protein